MRAKLVHGSAKLQDPDRVKARMPKEIKAQKSELSKARTLTEWEAEERRLRPNPLYKESKVVALYFVG